MSDAVPAVRYAGQGPAGDRAKRYRWLISYADMITLLMAMFVLMLSLSNVNLEKFREQATEMQRAFNQPAATSPDPTPLLRHDPSVRDEDVAAAAQQRRWRADAVRQIRDALSGEAVGRASVVIETEVDVVIRFPERAVFASGSAELQYSALPALQGVVAVLQRVDGQIVVSGHTDNVPIVTERFRSNWDLSVARAVAVVHLLLQDGRLAPGRITAQGFADSRAITDNDTPEGRAQNRRVEIALAMPERPSGGASPARDRTQ